MRSTYIVNISSGSPLKNSPTSELSSMTSNESGFRRRYVSHQTDRSSCHKAGEPSLLTHYTFCDKTLTDANSSPSNEALVKPFVSVPLISSLTSICHNTALSKTCNVRYGSCSCEQHSLLCSTITTSLPVANVKMPLARVRIINVRKKRLIRKTPLSMSNKQKNFEIRHAIASSSYFQLWGRTYLDDITLCGVK